MPPNPSPLRRVVVAGDYAALTGGQAKVAIDSAVLLAGAGIEVQFFAATGPVAPELHRDGITVHCLNQPTILDDPDRLRAMRRGLWNREALARLRALCDRFDPRDTVLHAHGYAKALSPAVGRVLAHGRLRSVFTMHEYFLACPNGGFYDYRRGEICRRKPLGLSCLTTNCDVRHASHKAWRVLRGWVAAGPGALPRGLSDVICISRTQRAVMAPFLPPSARLHQVDNPVAVAGPPVAAAANRMLVFVGRLSPEKGGLQLAIAARELGLPVLFVGDGPQAGAIRAANPEARITGWVSPAQVQAHLAQARALVFPSLWYEGQPLAPIEALLRGVPVVCGRWSAAAEEVTDGANGLVYDSPTPQALAQALRRLPGLGAFDPAPLAARMAPARHLERLREVYDLLLAG